MRIKEVTIENYLSLKKVTLSFGNLTVLVGKNGSGKTNILEALFRFFDGFIVIGGGIPAGSLNDYYWHERDTTKPIRISVELELEEEDFENIFQPLHKAVRDSLKNYLGEKCFSLSIKRQIVSPQAGWKTESLSWGDVQLVCDDKPIELSEFFKILFPNEVTKDFTLVLFTPQEMAGDRLLVDNSRKVAYYSSPQIDILANIGIIKKSSEAVGENYKDWVTKHGFNLIERPPTQEEVPFLMQPVTTDLLNNILANIANNIKGKFKFISAARDERFRGTRSPIIGRPVLDSERALSLDTTRENEQKWSTLRGWLEHFLGKRIDPHPTELLVVENGLRLPIQYLGGGEQEVFLLMWYLLEEGFIYGIEEPENHFHPEYLRKLFNFFRQISEKRQIIISTHSPMLVDKVNVENNWIVKRSGKETEVQRLRNKEELKFVLAELGLVPSDIYLKDFILFVEGETEKEIIPILGEKIGYEELIENIGIIPIGGGSQLKNYLKIWIRLLDIVPGVEYLVLLDKHSEYLIPDLIRELQIDNEKLLILKKGSIEDYYPINIIVKAFKDLFGIEIKEEDIRESEPREKEIERILKEHEKLQRGWKINIGRYVALELSEDQVPEEIKIIFQKVKERLGNPNFA